MNKNSGVPLDIKKNKATIRADLLYHDASNSGYGVLYSLEKKSSKWQISINGGIWASNRL
jgi:hypothetical protein